MREKQIAEAGQAHWTEGKATPVTLYNTTPTEAKGRQCFAHLPCLSSSMPKVISSFNFDCNLV